jgi:hypothetical protein
MSDDLIAFLKAWHDWATNGAPNGKPFFRCVGLCSNVEEFFDEGPVVGKVEREIEGIFSGEEFPFGGPVAYEDRRVKESQHKNPERLAWVRAKLVEAGELIA